MKKLLSILALACLYLTASAQLKPGVFTFSFVTTNSPPTTNAVIVTSTNFFGLGVTNSVVQVCDVTDNAGVSITANGTGASAGTTRFDFVRSFDNQAHWETSPVAANQITLTLSGTVPQTVCASLDLKGATHVQLFANVNTNSVGVTNVALSFSVKSIHAISY